MTQINQPVSPFVQNFSSVESIVEDYSDYNYGEDRNTKTYTDREKIENDLRGATIHLAWYGYGDYSGDSFVLYEKDWKLYEVNGGHCSCSGLEGQWKPEETSIEALRMRKISGDYKGATEAQKILDAFLATR